MTTPTATPQPARPLPAGPSARLAVAAAAAWGLLFAAVHVYWLFGGRALLPDGLSVTGNLPLLVIDVLAVPLSLAATALALALIRPWGLRFGKLPRTAGWAVAAVLAVHALPTVPDWLLLAAGRQELAGMPAMERFATALYEPWFLLGAVLFAAAVHTTGRGRRRG
ncbi:DUF3995 domain-containing protein [Kitasatospora sp. NPDC051853]|uniref:DUF3995 domain-containing protein n=1 Tax=Kitasatospora sp. NPDC051853 TaxID=3364058 RepID=UPI0037BAF26C